MCIIAKVLKFDNDLSLEVRMLNPTIVHKSPNDHNEGETLDLHSLIYATIWQKYTRNVLRKEISQLDKIGSTSSNQKVENNDIYVQLSIVLYKGETLS